MHCLEFKISVINVLNLYILICSLSFQNVKTHKYSNREDFLADVELLVTNSMTFNGPESQFTKKAKEIYEACQASVRKVIKIILIRTKIYLHLGCFFTKQICFSELHYMYNI